MGSWEENVTLQCSIVRAIIESLICKSGVISNDQRGNDFKVMREAYIKLA